MEKNSLTLKLAAPLCAALAALTLGACASGGSSAGCPNAPSALAKNKKDMKLTKEMFYKDGKFDQEAAKQAYIDMMENLGYPISENLRDNMWVSDFALGDFPAVGMGGI